MGDRVRLFTRRGFNWSDRYPLIVEAARKLRTAAFVMDGEAVFLDDDGKSDFDKLHARQHDAKIRLVAFDLLTIGADDVRREPLDARKDRLAKLLARANDGIQLSEHLAGEIGPTMFQRACEMRLEGILSKHRHRPYRPGRSRHWLKIKNRSHPAMSRVMEAFV
jgi:bifunctional non-homologous end joining protein LigD